jgi:hypothetical protein
MEQADLKQQVLDEVHLQALSLVYKVNAAFAAFFSLFGLLYAGMFGIIATAVAKLPQARGAQAPPEELGWIFGGLGFGLFCVMVLLAYLNWRTATCLTRRESRTFCQVMAGFNCLHIPYGTALGVCTFIVLARPSVARLFLTRQPVSTSA